MDYSIHFIVAVVVVVVAKSADVIHFWSSHVTQTLRNRYASVSNFVLLQYIMIFQFRSDIILAQNITFVTNIFLILKEKIIDSQRYLIKANKS